MASPQKHRRQGKRLKASKCDPNTLVNKAPAGKTSEEATAGLVAEGLVSNTFVLQSWATPVFGDLDLTALQNSMDERTMAVARGSLTGAEELLMSQAVSLNAIYANLAIRAKHTQLLDHFERYLRLGLKAQAQCRATCETIGALKNPPVFARQANLANGPQQVNNGPVVNGAPARAAIQETAPNKLLEAHGERLDGDAPAGAGASDSAVAAVAALDRPANR